jgi:site-specific recombinase XerD
LQVEQLPENTEHWSPARFAEALAGKPLRCADCRGVVRVAPVEAPAVIVNRPDASPVVAYLASLAKTSRRAMADALEIIAGVLGRPSALEVEWHRLTYLETSAIQAKLLASGRSPDYTKKIMCALRGVLRAARKLRLISHEQYAAATELEKIRGSRLRKIKNLKPGELESLLAATRDDAKPMRALRDRALLAVLAGGGFRRSEAASLSTDSFDRERRTITVIGKGDKERVVPLPEWAARAIIEFLDARGFKDGPLLCPVSQPGVALREPLHGGQAIYIVLRRLGWRSGIEGLAPPHAFRRSYCTRLLENGADVFATQKLLGHSSPDTTFKMYDERGVDALQKAADLLPDPEKA